MARLSYTEPEDESTAEDPTDLTLDDRMNMLSRKTVFVEPQRNHGEPPRRSRLMFEQQNVLLQDASHLREQHNYAPTLFDSLSYYLIPTFIDTWYSLFELFHEKKATNMVFQ